MVSQRDDESHTEDTSIGGLIAGLSRDTQTLVRQEVELLRAEVYDKINQLQNAVISAAAGSVVALAGFVVLFMAAAYGLAAAGLPMWAGALIAGGVGAGIGVGLLLAARSKMAPGNLEPERAVTEAKKTKNMIESELGQA